MNCDDLKGLTYDYLERRLSAERQHLVLVLFAVALQVLSFGALAADAVAPLTKEKLLGTWHGGETNGLNVTLVFEERYVHIHTYREKKGSPPSMPGTA
jgi:hypothetical protein